jgi:type IV secretory pathway TrbF-like protein
MTKRRPNNHKKTPKARQRWLKQLGAGVVALVALGIVVLAVVGMTKAGGSENTARRSEITPVVQEQSTQTASHQGEPAMAFDATSVDFGDVPLDTPVSYAFPFANMGDATLQIEDVQVKTLEGC